MRRSSRFFLALLVSSVTAIGLAPAAQAAEPASGPRTLTVAECLQMALAQNPDLKSERLEARIGALEFDQANHRYGLFLEAGPDVTRSIRPTSQKFLSGGVSRLEELNQQYRASLRQELSTGGNVSLKVGNGVFDTNSASVDVNPAFTPTASLNFSQPLLRDMLSGQREIEIARLGSEQARLKLRTKLLQLVADTEIAYWELVSAREEIRVRQQALGLVRDLLTINQEKAKAGMLAKLDVLQAEASLAVRESGFLAAQRRSAKAEDALRRLIDPSLTETAWNDALLPSERPTYQVASVSFERAWMLARAGRPDLGTATLERSKQQAVLDQAGNRLWPRLDVEGSAGVTNLATRLDTAVGAMPQLQNYDLRAGVSMQWPLGATSERDEYEKGRLRVEQANVNAFTTEQTAFVEVRDAVRDVQINGKRVEATGLAKRLADAKLDAEQAKLKAGLSTNFQVLQFQEDLQQASLEEVEATIQYLQALTRLEQVQGTLLAARGLELVEAKPVMTMPEVRR